MTLSDRVSAPACNHVYVHITKSSYRPAPYDKCTKCGDIREVRGEHQERTEDER